MSNIINVFQNTNSLSRQVRQRLDAAFAKHQISLRDDPHPDALLNVCIGGDGSFLRAIHQSRFSQIPFVGVNTGHLGFYQEIEIEKIESFVKLWCQGSYQTDHLIVLEAFTRGDKQSPDLKCINEFVVKSRRNSIVHFDIYIGNNYLQTYAGDAIIFSTPSGSTAYNLSAGGAILYQTLDGYQMTPIAPINSRRFRSLTQPIILPLTAQVHIRPLINHEDELMIIYDGMESQARPNQDITIAYKGTNIKRLVFDEEYYWKNIRDKFL